MTALARDVCVRHAIPPARVLGHSDIAPLRKDDPGELFPWSALMKAGIALRVAPLAYDRVESVSPGELRAALAAIGYECPADDDDDIARAAIRAFQRRWRPQRVDGVADAETAVLVLAVENAAATTS